MDATPGCAGKIRYPTRKFAVESRREQRAKGRHLHVYRCGACGGWHLTKSSEPRSEAEARQRAYLGVESA